ncbi:MAG: TetR/AcrR family transcriptional regulator [Kordiimonadaceae bacterium]|nr:TetR/AcrR family transcriptional regulator [Kordiimonadaceae bacterium]
MTSPSRKELLESRANQPNKFNVRRGEIAAATLEALAENGYAKTSLRDIAAKADFSLGTLHYYFENKVELISFCVRTYKRKFVEDLNELVEQATSAQEIVDGFCKQFVHAIEVDTNAHCLWYDTRSQAMFDISFREVVREVEVTLQDTITEALRAIERLGGKPIPLTDRRAYWLLDGMFYHYLQEFLQSDQKAVPDFEVELRSFFDSLV